MLRHLRERWGWVTGLAVSLPSAVILIVVAIRIGPGKGSAGILLCAVVPAVVALFCLLEVIDTSDNPF